VQRVFSLLSLQCCSDMLEGLLHGTHLIDCLVTAS
jgi:hypothetical protein